MITSASVPVFSRRRFVALFGAAASLVLMGCQRPVMGHNRLGHERGKAPSGTVYFQDGFDQDADTFRSWDQVYINNNSATTDAAVVRVGTHSLKLSVEDIDTNTFGWSGIRSQIVKRDLFFEGGERYIGWSTYVPANHPTPTSWHNLAQFGYTGETPPPTLFGMFASHHFKLIDDSASQGILKWRSPTVLKGAWHDFVVRILFHRNPNIGFVELWVDGVKQTMTNGQQRIYYSTLNPLESADALSHLHICNYRRRNQMQWSTIYHDAVKVGDSYAAVDPAG
jgi:polysaccharide lyase-like protein